MKYLSLTVFLFIAMAGFAQTSESYFKEALAFQKQGKFETALQSINKALHIDSTQLKYYDIKANCLIELKEIQQAYDLYSRLISYYPAESYLYGARGNLLMRVGEFDPAIEDFTKSITISENDTAKKNGLLNRAAAKMSKRDFESAYYDLITAYRIDSTDLGTLTDLGAVCDEIGRGDETLLYLLKAVQIDSTYYPAYGNIGFKYQEMGQYAKAIEYYNKVLKFNPKEPLGFSNRSYNEMKLGNLKSALADITKSLQLYPENPYAYRIRALIYIEEKQFDKACIDLKQRWIKDLPSLMAMK